VGRRGYRSNLQRREPAADFPPLPSGARIKTATGFAGGAVIA